MDNTKAFSFTNSKGQVYYLHTQTVTIKNGRSQVIYFFARDVREDKALAAVPAGYEVSETISSSMPVLRKVK